MLKRFEGLLLFGKNIWSFTFVISLMIWALTNFATGKTFMLLFGYILLSKILTDILIYFLYNSLRANGYLFFQNLGFSKTQLWIFTLITDYLLFLFLVFLFSLFK